MSPNLQLISKNTNKATDNEMRTVNALTIALLSVGPEVIENNACPKLATIPSKVAMIKNCTT
jgi:hypothetical protein